MEVREGGDGEIVADAYLLFAVAILPPRVIMGISMDVYNFTRAGILPQFFLIKKFFSHYGAIKGKHKKYIELI